MASADSHRVPKRRTWEDWRIENVTEFGAPLEAGLHPRPQGL